MVTRVNNFITALEMMAEDKVTWTYVRDISNSWIWEEENGGGEKNTPQDALFCEKSSKQHPPKKVYNNTNSSTKSKFKCHLSWKRF